MTGPGRVEAAVVRECRRRVWRGNRASLELGVAAVRLARSADAGRPGAGRALRVVLAHLLDCSPAGDALDAIRARAAARWVEAVGAPGGEVPAPGEKSP